MVKKKNQIIKFEQNLCNATVDNNEILFVRVGDIVTSADARFEVPITHDALVIRGGGDVRYYKSGTYDIFDDKKQKRDWKRGISIEVVYIPKDTRVLVKWGTPNRLRYRDDASNKVITVGARGEADVSIVNAEQFFRKVVGAKKEFNLDEFQERFKETIATEFADIFLKTINEKHLTYDQFTANKKVIAESVCKILSLKFERDWGMAVLNFKINDFHLFDDDMEAIEAFSAEKQKQEKLKEYLAEVERLDDKQWERDKYLRQLELQDKAAYYEVLKVIGRKSEENEKKEKDLLCPNCGTKYKPADKFCPHCGKRVSSEPIICPDCGKSNESTALFCANCGKKLIKD